MGKKKTSKTYDVMPQTRAAEIKNVGFDLFEVLVQGRWGEGLMKAEVEKCCGIPAEEYWAWTFVPALDDLWLDTMRGKVTDRQYWEELIVKSGFKTTPKKLMNCLRTVMKEQVTGMRSLISRLRTKGYRLFLVSDITPDMKDFVFDQHLWLSDFEEKYLSCDIGKLKRDVGLFETVLADLEVKPWETLFVDDFYANANRALSAGMGVVVFKSVGQLERELENYGIKVL